MNINLPTQYQWLLKEQGPKMLIEALKEFGTLETPGTKNNPKIIAWAGEVGQEVAKVYKADSIAWCGLFMAVVAKRAGKEVPKSPLWALNWGTFGKEADNPKLGDVLVFVRTTAEGTKAGHVGIYVGEDVSCFHVLGGNQSDRVCITRIAKARLYTARRPEYKNQPANVRTVALNPSGLISQNEA